MLKWQLHSVQLQRSNRYECSVPDIGLPSNSIATQMLGGCTCKSTCLSTNRFANTQLSKMCYFLNIKMQCNHETFSMGCNHSYLNGLSSYSNRQQGACTLLRHYAVTTHPTCTQYHSKPSKPQETASNWDIMYGTAFSCDLAAAQLHCITVERKYFQVKDEHVPAP